MPAWLWITVLAAVVFVLLVTFGRGWWRVRWVLDWLRVLDARRWWYSWQRAAHVIEAPLEPLPEYPLPWPRLEGDWLPSPPDFYGSMDLHGERALGNPSKVHYLPAQIGSDMSIWYGDVKVDPAPWEDLQSDARIEGPDWREQTAAALSPEALEAEPCCSDGTCHDQPSCYPGCPCHDPASSGPGDLPSLDPGPDPGPVIDMGYLSLPTETQEAVEWALLEHKAPDIAAFMRAQDDGARAYGSALALGWADFMRDLTAALA